MKPNPQLAVAYLRVSTEMQTLTQQRYAIEQWAAQHSIQVASWHEDFGVSGKLPIYTRHGLCMALAEIKQRKAGVLVASARDRLARDTRQIAILENALADCGAVVRTADGKSDDMSDEGKLMRTMCDAFAQYERAKIAMRVGASKAHRRAAGMSIGLPPFGWAVEGVSPHKRLVELPSEQEAIKYIKAASSLGYSQQSIADALNMPPMKHKPRGKAWHVTTIARILKHNALDRVDGVGIVE